MASNTACCSGASTTSLTASLYPRAGGCPLGSAGDVRFRMGTKRRELITLSIVAAVIVAALGGTILILNATLYSAGGFVRGYLDSIARSDVAGALELAGTIPAGDSSRELL